MRAGEGEHEDSYSSDIGQGKLHAVSDFKAGGNVGPYLVPGRREARNTDALGNFIFILDLPSVLSIKLLALELLALLN